MSSTRVNEEARSGFIHRTFWWFASYRASFWILAVWFLMIAVWVVPFQVTGQPAETLERIGWQWAPMRVVYAFMAVALVLCTYSRLTRDWEKVRARNLPKQPPSASVVVELMSLDDLSGQLEKRGYDVERQTDRLHAVKNRFAPLGGSVFHVAVVLFGVAIIMHFAVSKSMSFRAIEGQPIVDTLPASQDAEWGRRLVEGDTVKSIDVEYHEDVLLFTTLSSTIAQADGRTYDASLSQPHWFDPLTMLSIQDYGLAPVVTYESADGTEDQAIAAMNIFPPGAEDSIELAESGLRLYVVAFPDYGQIEGRDVSLSYNIAEPRFRLAVKSMLTGEVLARGVVSLGEPLAIGDAVLTVDELRRHGTYRLNRSIGMPLMVLASLLMVGGLSLRLLSRRHDVRAWETHDGLRVDAWLDVGGRAAGLRRLHRFLPIAESKRARS